MARRMSFGLLPHGESGPSFDICGLQEDFSDKDRRTGTPSRSGATSRTVIQPKGATTVAAVNPPGTGSSEKNGPDLYGMDGNLGKRRRRRRRPSRPSM